ncbi:MAG: MBL fold metallo-hydrolase [Candidatus Omnitrophica bacterium]|nr:MBL fold metallo-hydrolase [Candidatus Omnitrophota bacterium]
MSITSSSSILEKNKAMKFLVIFLIILICSSVGCSADEIYFTVHFIDAGEGDAILIKTEPGQSLLIDTGNLITGRRVCDYLKENGVEKLSYLILTHPHLDHIGGAFYVLQEYDVGQTFTNGEDIGRLKENQDPYRWLQELMASRTKRGALSAGDLLRLGEVSLRVLSPSSPSPFSGINANSIVSMIEYKNFRMLLMADATDATERYLLKQGSNLKSDILKVAHHGHNDASSPEFIRAVSPSLSIISVNKDNSRGYPSKAVLELIKASGSMLLRTDRDGDVVVKVARNGKFSVIMKRF